MSKSPTIAVIICHYEQPEGLERSIRSIASQIRPADQIIVVDDGSYHQPEISGLVKQCSSPIQLLLNPVNYGGPAIPRNKAIGVCQCSHLVFLDSDDTLFPYALRNMEQIWQHNPSALVHGDQITWGRNIKHPFLQKGLIIKERSRGIHPNFYEKLIMNGNRIFLSGSGGPKSVFESCQFDSQQRWEDFDLWLRLARSGHQFEYTCQIHSLYRAENGSRSGSKQSRHQGCEGIRQKHLKNRQIWRWPLWYWKQRYL
jgi:GT2 family glycosyltransferase